jgi:hypothetical protein
MGLLMRAKKTKDIVSRILADARTTSQWLVINTDSGEFVDSSEGGIASFSLKEGRKKKTCVAAEHAEALDLVSALALAKKLRQIHRCVVLCCLATG